MEIKSETNHLNISKICRTCLSEKDVMHTLFAPDESFGQSVAERIMGFTNVRIEDGDGLPSLICLGCVHQVCKAFSFKQLCEQSDTNLRQYLGRPPIVKDTVEQVEEVSHKDDEDDKDFSMLTAPVDLVNIIKQEEEVIGYSMVGGFADNFELVDPLRNSDNDKEDNIDISMLGPIDPIKQEEGVEATDHQKVKQEEEVEVTDYSIVAGLIDNFSQDDSSDNSDEDDNDDENFSMFTAPLNPSDEKAVAQKQLKESMKLLNSKLEKNIMPKSSKVILNKKESLTNQCDVCKRQFVYLQSFVRHLKTHIGDRPFKCKVCPRWFIREKFLNKHMITHIPDEQKPHECEVCKKRFIHKSLLTKHILKHSEENPFVCKICNKGCSTKNTLLMHMKYIHAKKQGDPGLLKHICDYCKSELPDAASLDIHIKQHTGDRPFLCNICGKNFLQRSHLDLHLRSHTGERPFSCEICQKKYVSKAILKMHMRTHTNEKPFACDICGKAFKRSGTLKNHKLSHGTEKPFECNICQKRFPTVTNLRYHMRNHTGERPYVCNLCGRGFTLNRFLVQHMKAHSRERT